MCSNSLISSLQFLFGLNVSSTSRLQNIYVLIKYLISQISHQWWTIIYPLPTFRENNLVRNVWLLLLYLVHTLFSDCWSMLLAYWKHETAESFQGEIGVYIDIYICFFFPQNLFIAQYKLTVPQPDCRGKVSLITLFWKGICLFYVFQDFLIIHTKELKSRCSQILRFRLIRDLFGSFLEIKTRR